MSGTTMDWCDDGCCEHPYENKWMVGHLSKIYQLLVATMVFASLGAYTHHLYEIGGIITFMLCLILIIVIGTTPLKMPGRTTLLFVFGFCEGACIGPLTKLAVEIDPSLISMAFGGTLIIFSCFTVSAMWAPDDYWLRYGGVLGSSLSLLFFLSIMNYFVMSETIFLIELYGGLMVFCGYVLYDTQRMIHDIKCNKQDHVWHALTLFIDFVGVFVRVLIILIRNKDSKKKRSNR
jgi:FtsH-binding integral membrane protein